MEQTLAHLPLSTSKCRLSGICVNEVYSLAPILYQEDVVSSTICKRVKLPQYFLHSCHSRDLHDLHPMRQYKPQKTINHPISRGTPTGLVQLPRID